MNSIDLNCDLGEGMDNDALLMPFISSANIACGYHAGDEDTMKRTVELALAHHVQVGAHPGFADKEHFGRVERHLSKEEVYDLISEQIAALKKIAQSFQAAVHHVKPHGALYNMAAKDKSLATTIAKAVKEAGSSLVLYGLSGSFLISEAKANGLKTASEVFADRTYQDNGSLTPRSHPEALIEHDDKSIEQVLGMITQHKVRTVSRKLIPIVAETVCIHGDGQHAVTFAKAIHHSLKQHRIDIKAI